MSNQITDEQIRAIHNELQDTHDVGWTDIAVMVVRDVLARQDTARRDYFAAEALAGVMMSATPPTLADVAVICYGAADAMLAERQSPPAPDAARAAAELAQIARDLFAAHVTKCAPRDRSEADEALRHRAEAVLRQCGAWFAEGGK